MFHRDSTAPPLGHTTTTITNRGNQSTMRGNQTSNVVEGHRSPRPRRRHEPPRERSTNNTRMTKGKAAATNHFHHHHQHRIDQQQPSHIPTDQPHSSRDYKQTTTAQWLQRQRPQGGNDVKDLVDVRYKDGGPRLSPEHIRGCIAGASQ